MIELKDVSMDYGGHRALDGLRLSVPEGCVYGLLGPNGAGKSTTIHLVTGLLRPTSGEITVGGIDAAADPARARAILAYVPESVALYSHLSGIENLQLFSRLAGRTLGVDESKACLSKAGLQADAHARRVVTYSKGMRQKVGLAIALAKDARAVVLDEPSSGLDPMHSTSGSRSHPARPRISRSACTVASSASSTCSSTRAHRSGCWSARRLAAPTKVASVLGRGKSPKSRLLLPMRSTAWSQARLCSPSNSSMRRRAPSMAPHVDHGPSRPTRTTTQAGSPSSVLGSAGRLPSTTACRPSRTRDQSSCMNHRSSERALMSTEKTSQDALWTARQWNPEPCDP